MEKNRGKWKLITQGHIGSVQSEASHRIAAMLAIHKGG